MLRFNEHQSHGSNTSKGKEHALRFVVDSNVWIKAVVGNEKDKKLCTDAIVYASNEGHIIRSDETRKDLKDAVHKLLRKQEIDRNYFNIILTSHDKGADKCQVSDYKRYEETYEAQLSKCPDETDRVFLILAHQQGASHIITRDKHLLNMGEYMDTKIVTPGMFTKEIEAMREYQDISNKKEAFGRYAAAVGAERYRIEITDAANNPNTSYTYDGKSGGERGNAPEEIQRAMAALKEFSNYGKNLHVFPLSEDKHHIVVDGMNGKGLKGFRDDGYSPACVIRSGPNAY